MKKNGKKKAAAKKTTKKSAAKKDAKPSFLKRLLKRDSDAGKGSGAGKAEKKKPLTPLERSIAEIRQLQKVGERDPERLATLLANILQKEKAKHDDAQEKFDALVWDIVNREEQDDDADASNTSTDDSPAGPDAEVGGQAETDGADEPPPGPASHN
ncbi:MAG: hypothetical protein HN712_18735 [Gemmatimonadetes bacterium]|jgi:hypothetical protein|nr:hypothetical protein [Gemmatimonadota bacterium]MBT7862361.1 hypothetical protein [Gemmatimonadota bacterium]